LSIFWDRKVVKAQKLTTKIVELLKRQHGQSVKEIAKQMDVNRTFLSGYLSALEEHGYVKSRKIGPAKVYFNEENSE
jgi:predicted ArsR family transcriptional regulator